MMRRSPLSALSCFVAVLLLSAVGAAAQDTPVAPRPPDGHLDADEEY